MFGLCVVLPCPLLACLAIHQEYGLWPSANVAQLVEQLTRNEQVVRSSRIIGFPENPVAVDAPGFFVSCHMRDSFGVVTHLVTHTHNR